VLYLTGEGDFQVFFNTGALQSAIMEDGGPMGKYNSHGNHVSNVIDGISGNDATKIASLSCAGKMVSDHLPHSGGPLQSSLGR